MTGELSKVNELLKAKLEAVCKDHRTQDEISSLKQSLETKDRLIEELEKRKRIQLDDMARSKDQQIQQLTLTVKELETVLEEEQRNKRRLDQQWQSTLNEVTQRIQEIEAELSQRNE